MTTRDEQEAIYAYLRALCDKAAGLLTADAVVEDAARKSSPLHHLFQWDDALAAHQHRLDQARELIRSVHVVYTTRRETFRAPAFCKHPSTDRGYAQVASLRSDRDRAREALLREFVNARGALERARMMAHALGLQGDVDKLLAGVMEVVQVAESS